MSKEILGVKIDSLQEPIREALKGYSEISQGQVDFDLDTAVELELTPEKPNSARSVSAVKHLGEIAATLYVIAFKPSDGTGDYNTYPRGTLYTGDYPADAKYYPRSKAAIDTEAHLTLVSKLIDSDIEPVQYAGSLGVLGLIGRQISRIGFVGQNPDQFSNAMHGIDSSEPTTTLTTGYRDSLGDLRKLKYTDRFGDPHAIVNETPDTLQVCGFIGMPSNSETPIADRLLIRSLRPQELK